MVNPTSDDHKLEALKAALKSTPHPVCVELFDCARQEPLTLPPDGHYLYRNDAWDSDVYVLPAANCLAWLYSKLGAGGVNVALPKLPHGCYYHIRVFPCLVEVKVYQDLNDPLNSGAVEQIGATLYEEFACQ